MKFKYLFFLFIFFESIGCNIFKNDQKIVGDIFLIKNSDDNRYHLVIYNGTVNSNILEDYVLSIHGNDRSLLIKCQNDNNDILFYRIDHNKGKPPINTTSVSSQEYLKLKEIMGMKYEFYAN